MSGLERLEGGMATSSFIATTPAGRIVVSILDNQDDEAALRLARTVDHMGQHGVPTGRVIPRADGRLLSRVDGKCVLVKEFVPGRTLRRLPDATLITAAGLLGRIHGVATGGLEVPVGLRRLSPQLRNLLADFPDQTHARWIRGRLARLDPYFPADGGPRRAAWTVIHGDFTPSNIVVTDDDRLFAIDWETVTVDDPMLDCGMSVLNMCVTEGRLDSARLRLFAEGYRSSGRRFEDDWIRPAVEYAAVIVSFHRYRRHHMRFPNPARFDYFRIMVDFVEREFPGSVSP
ncbi:phosphotransferase [Symbioplanes lichenis]|uniref:phosphotransferase n=1 Tax=Symbioplanes lichenis TaxID=1629072 RepID=UPI002739E786|nr:phosphotransferase [Actinoplanes lichenis]